MSPEVRAGSPARYVFVLGVGRCGSTVVHEVLARHPAVGFVSNLEDRFPRLRLGGRLNNPLYRRIPPRLTRKGRLRCAPSEAYRLLDQQVSPVLSMPFRDLTALDVTPWLATRLEEFFDSRARAQGRPVFLHKFTGWPRVGLLREVFPDARFVHVIRDGRAVANSWLQMPWYLGYRGPEHWQFGLLPAAYQAEWEAAGRSHALLAGLGWKLLMDAFEAARRDVAPGHWLDVRYEDLVTHPRSGLAEIVTFMGLDWDDSFEVGFAAHRFTTARGQAFRRDLDARSLELLDESLDGHLRRYGYEPGGQPRHTHRTDSWS